MKGRNAGENTINETASAGPTMSDPADGSAMVENVSGANPRASPPVDAPLANANGRLYSEASTTTLSSAVGSRQSATGSTRCSQASTTAPGNAVAEPEARISPACSDLEWGESSSSAGGHAGAESATLGHSAGGQPDPQAPTHAVVQTLASATGVSATFGCGQTNALPVSPDVVSSQANVVSADVRVRSRWRWFVVLGIIGLTMAVPALPLVWVVVMGKAELARAIAETDALDPGWRLEDLRSAWSQLPPEQNGWPLIMRAVQRLESTYIPDRLRWWDCHFDSPRFSDDIGAITDGSHRLSQEVLIELRSRLAEISGTWEVLRQLPKYQYILPPCAVLKFPDIDIIWEFAWGRRDIWRVLCWYQEQFLHESKPELAEECLLVLGHLAYTQEKMVDAMPAFLPVEGCIGSWRSNIGLGADSYLPWHPVFVERVSRHLAMSEISDRALQKLQEQTELLLACNPLVQSLRRYRADMHHIYSQIEAGRTDWWQSVNASDIRNIRWTVREPTNPTMWEVLKYYLGSYCMEFVNRLERNTAPYFIYRNHAVMLRRYNELQRLAERPPQKVLAALTSVRGGSLDPEDLWGSYFLPKIHLLRLSSGSGIETELYLLIGRRAVLEALRAALACERYRLKYGQWPDKLEALVPDFLPQVPSDPLDVPNPVKVARTADGLVVYSIGSDLVDNGGDCRHDIVIRLFDPEKRGLPPP